MQYDENLDDQADDDDDDDDDDDNDNDCGIDTDDFDYMLEKLWEGSE